VKGQILGRKAPRQFDVKSFFATVEAGRTIESYKLEQPIFLQPDL